MIVVSDSTPLRYLVFIELEHVLPRLFGTVYAPPEVVAELQRSKNPILEPVRLNSLEELARLDLKRTVMAIDTARLQLLPNSPEHLLALLEGTQQFEERSGLRAADGLRDFLVSDEVSPAFLAQLRAALVADPWVHGFAVVHRESGEVIGSAGFKGPPDEDGMVEIAYGIVPSHQEQGYATEAAMALVAFAFGSGRVRLVRAHTLVESNASTRILTKCGFESVGEIVDPEDGLVRRWERTHESA